MRLVFMGTPAFVVPVLDGLVSASQVQIAGVYTPPDRPGGRGRRPEMSPIKTYCLERGLALFQPSSLRPAETQQELTELAPDVVVVAAYGKLLPAPVLAIPHHGCLNLHPSLLPSHRGPSPVATAILEEDSVTGTTLMLLDQGMDTGPTIAQRLHHLSGEETAEALTATLFQLGTQLLLEKLDSWVGGQLAAEPQEEAKATITRKLERADGQADWTLPAAALERKRRAFTPWPGLFTHWQGKVLKLLDVASLPFDANGPAEANGQQYQPGQVLPLELEHTPMGIVTSEGTLGLKLLQLEGRRPVPAGEFLKGYPQFLDAIL